MVDRAAGRSPAVGAVSAVDVPFVASASERSGEDEMSEFTVWDCGGSTFSLLR
jgi:hypothetical protein